MRSAVSRGLWDSSSIMLGYFPVAVSFGVAAISAGLAPWMAVLISVCIYAGASQFILLLLIAQQTDVWSMVFIVIAVNLRHVFYGPALLSQFNSTSLEPKPYAVMAFGLTDEVFAAARARLSQLRVAPKAYWYIGLQLGAYSSWVIGTAVGAYLASDWLSRFPILQQSLAFVLPALFFALLLDMINSVDKRLLIAAALSTGLSSLFFAAHTSLIIGMVVGCGWALVTQLKRKRV
ncbi:MAG TPA: AzlC family ABC transporter permease [Paenalcaligenes hominis]|nr:AzlC family ABC transporter permease [Paenalcaligenes hominis]